MEDTTKTTKPRKPAREVKKERLLNRIDEQLEAKNIDEAIWLTAQLYTLELRASKVGTKDMKTALASFSKMLIDMKKGSPVSDLDKEELLAELLEYMDGEKRGFN